MMSFRQSQRLLHTVRTGVIACVPALVSARARFIVTKAVLDRVAHLGGVKGASAARTLMRFSGVPRSLGAVVLLKGSSEEALRPVKRAVQVCTPAHAML